MASVSTTYRNESAQGLASENQIRRQDKVAAGHTVQPGDAAAASVAQGQANASTISVQLGVQLTGAQEPEFATYGADGRRTGDNKQTTASGESKDAQPAIPSEKQLQDPVMQQEIAQLRAIEEKVKAHEAAHKSAGGTLTGPVSYTYTRGPDGKSYITGGEVPISASPGKTPQETASRMQQVIRAALAPADPSPQDRAVAAQAANLAQQARQEQSNPKTADSATVPGAQQDTKEANAQAAGRPPAGMPEPLSGVPPQSGTGTQTTSSAKNSVSGDGTAYDGSVISSPIQFSAPSQASASGERKPAGEDSLTGTASGKSLSVYSDPAVTGQPETTAQQTTIDAQKEVRSSAVFPDVPTSRRPESFAATPAMITGFSPSKQISLYA